MRYVRDRTGRFENRPHFDPSELDVECESIITSFLKGLHGQVCFPVSTDDLTKLVERDAKSLDLYADLSAFGNDVEGVTEFARGSKPSVRISQRLSENDHLENRLRTTLTHEYGHVRLHSHLWEVEPPNGELLRRSPTYNKIVCKRETIVDAAQNDWMEWQAGYVCGALLMPKSRLVARCGQFAEEHNLFGPPGLESTAGALLISSVAAGYRVSEQAARVRLLKLGLLQQGARSPSLFE